MVMGYWSVAILFWQVSIDHIVNVLYKRCVLAKTRLRHPSLPFDSFPYPIRTICRRVCTLGQSRDNQTKGGWPYSMSVGLCPTRAKRSWEPRFLGKDTILYIIQSVYYRCTCGFPPWSIYCKSLCERSIITQSPFAQIVYVPQSLVPGIWQNPLPLTGPAHSHTVDTNHKTMKSVNSIVWLVLCVK